MRAYGRGARYGRTHLQVRAFSFFATGVRTGVVRFRFYRIYRIYIYIYRRGRSEICQCGARSGSPQICTCTSSDSQGIWLAKNVAEVHIAGSILAQKVIKTSMAYNIQTQRHS